MSLTLGMTGMDPATETALKAAFDDANRRLDGRWRLLPEAQAEHVMVDMDSMYGPMSWLRLHAAGKRVIGVTTAPRTQTDFHLNRPFDSDAIAMLLRSIAHEKGVDLDASVRISAAIGQTATAPPATAVPAAMPVAPPIRAPETANASTAAPKRDDTVLPGSSSATDDATSRTATPDARAPAATAADAVAPASKHESAFAGWLAPGALTRRVRYRRASGPTLLIDPVARRYHGPTTLKPFAAYFESAVAGDDFEALDDDAWARESAGMGAAQPMSRLEWLGGLVAGRGALLAGVDPDGRFRLNRWPQTEREYPRHFRIATAMMKGPATLAEIAAASDMPAADVADFINANLATGYAETASEPPGEPPEPAKPTGLFGRLRGR